MDGLQLVILKGYLKEPAVRVVGPYDGYLFTGTIAIPTQEDGRKYQYLKVSSFSCAEELSEVKEGSFLKIYGHLEINTSVIPCQKCGHNKTQYFTNVIVDNFVVLY
jgi:hypothetical protein